MRNFLIVGFPRSRTAWLANFLTHGNVSCGHELLSDCSTMADLPRLMDSGLPYCGSSETAAGHFMPLVISAVKPEAIICVHRHFEDVRNSLRSIGVQDDLRPLLDGLQYATLLPQSIQVKFSDLDDEETCRAILQHVAQGEHFDSRRFRMLRDFNVQITKARIADLSGTSASQQSK